MAISEKASSLKMFKKDSYDFRKSFKPMDDEDFIDEIKNYGNNIITVIPPLDGDKSKA